ncbi:MAG: CRISPR-associated endoribonuclease Cas6 [Candidatus Heimdallarchaeum aukensis]|uniref:CRISPR-associated endoribonuclease Cas6 n=1 Tax=Candidatus Heimdallarchaeum aukensis TaxID=2876573 RepID=A0A9Y1BKL9_9ARCH|nr:MAG: CRISPR-associated endoribonuclease Cas6 [Candidatus Heimdallarchaeum aukensis]
MRLKIFVEKITDGPLNFNYQHWLTSAILRKISDSKKEVSQRLHRKTKFKYYNFSNLIIEEKKFSKKGLYFKEAFFYFTSIDNEFLDGLATGVFKDLKFHLGTQQFVVKRIKIENKKNIKSDCTLKTLSPIYVKTLRRNKEGKLKPYDLTPRDLKFSENLHKNLLERYYRYFGRKPKQDFFEITSIRNLKLKRVLIKNSYRRCTLMTFDVQASRELLKFAYNTGLGEKTGLGFGCIEVIE